MTPDPPQRANVRVRLLSSFSAQSASLLLRTLLQLILVPIFLRGWGAALYADWLLVFSTAGFLSVLDLGMQTYFGNALLSAWSRQQPLEYRRILGIALVLYAAVLSTAVAVLVGIGLGLSWSRVIATSTADEATVAWTFGLLAASTLVLILTGLLTAVYRARGDYGLSTATAAIAEVLRGLATCVVVGAGGSMVQAAVAYLATAVAYWIGALVDQKRRYGEIPLTLAFPDGREFLAACSHAARYFIAGFAPTVLLNAPVLMIGRLSPATGGVVAFVTLRTLTGLVRQIVHQLSHAVGGEIGHRYAREDRTGTRQLLLTAGRLVSGVGGLLVGVVFVAAGPFLALWTRGQVIYDAWLCAAFLAAILATAPAQVAYMVFHYTNRPNVLVIAGGIQIVVAILLCLLLIGRYSVFGAAVGTGAAEFLSIGLLLPFAACRSVAYSTGRYLAGCLAVAGVAGAASVGIALALSRLMPVRTYIEIVSFGVVWSVLVAGPAFYLLLPRHLRHWLLDRGRAFVGSTR